MKQLDSRNLQDLTPGEIEAGVNVGFTIIEKTLPFFIALGNKIAEAIKNGPRIRRIRVLEEFAKVTNDINQHQQLAIEQLQKELAELKNKQ